MINELIANIYYRGREYMIIQRVLDSFKNTLDEMCIKRRMEPYCDKLNVEVDNETWFIFFERYEGSREDISQNRGGYIITMPYKVTEQWKKIVLEIISTEGIVKFYVQDTAGNTMGYDQEELETKVKNSSVSLSKLIKQQKLMFLGVLKEKFPEEMSEVNLSCTDGLKQLILECLNIDLLNHYQTKGIMNTLNITYNLEGIHKMHVTEEDIEAFKQIIDCLKTILKGRVNVSGNTSSDRSIR